MWYRNYLAQMEIDHALKATGGLIDDKPRILQSEWKYVICWVLPKNQYKTGRQAGEVQRGLFCVIWKATYSVKRKMVLWGEAKATRYGSVYLYFINSGRECEYC